MTNNATFIREIELDNINSLTEKSSSRCLKIHQKFVGEEGCVVWDAALVLIKYLFTVKGNKHVNGKVVLELGAGTGAVGLGAVVAGAAAATLTDLPEITSLIKLNIRENSTLLDESLGCDDNVVQAKVLRWGNKDDLDCLTNDKSSSVHLLNIECVLIADCIYYEDGVVNLYKTIVMLLEVCNPTAKVICSYERRDTGKKVELLQKFLHLLHSNPKLDTKYVHQEEMDEEYRSDDIFILIIKHLP